MKEKKQNFFQGAAILALAGILVKIIGACYKIPLGNLLGPVGMADFSIAYNIYALLFALSTSGIPSAVSKMVSEACAKNDFVRARQVYSTSYRAFSVVGFTGFAVMFFGADVISGVIGSKSAAISIKAVAPAVMFVCISAVNRGYFQGCSNMYPTAVSEVLESLGKLVFGIAAALCLRMYGFGDAFVSAGAIFGVSAGTFLSALFFVFCLGHYKKGEKPEVVSDKGIIPEILKLTLPITISATVSSFGNVIDSALAIHLLCDSGFSVYRAKWLFGAYNYAATLFNLPSVLTATLAVSVIPALSSALARKNINEAEKITNSAICITATIAFSAAFGLYALSDEIVGLLYGKSVGILCSEASAMILRYLCFAIPLLSIATVTNSILQAMGKVNVPVVSVFAGVLVKIVSNFILIRRLNINILGAAISTVFCYAIIVLLNMVALKKYGMIKIKIVGVLIKPIFSGMAVYVAAEYFSVITRNAFGCWFSTVFSVFVGFLACIATCFLLESVGKNGGKMIFDRESISKFLNNN